MVYFFTKRSEFEINTLQNRFKSTWRIGYPTTLRDS